ncbi:MAG: stage III sporulation protein AD, partial [Clostridia bacterium]|nr:stage III sporulation protein AD [Clostridia bacterium]
MTAVLIKVLAVLLLAASITLALVPHKPEYAFLLSLACGAAILIYILSAVIPQISRLSEAFSKAGGVASCFTVALKALGISYITGFVADTCRDFGQGSYAAKAELAGKCAIFII